MRQALILFALVVLTAGCAKRPAKVEIWKFTRCVKNGESWICECRKHYQTVNGLTGQVVEVCD